MGSAEFPAVLESVHGARDLLARLSDEWKLDESTRAPADLAVSELVTNALLHAGTPIRLRVSRLGSGVKVEVFDGDRRLPVVSSANPESLLANRSMTGRGLALIATISDRWGADPVGSGKVIWAELGTDRRIVASADAGGSADAGAASSSGGPARVDAGPHRPAQPVPAVFGQPVAAGAEPVEVDAITRGGRTVRLVGMPVPLLAESARQLADLRREVQMMDLSGSNQGDLGRVVQTGRPLVADLDFWARSERRLAEYAMSRGEDTVDLDLTVPDDMAERLDRLTTWLRRCAAKLARGRMLTLPAGPDVDSYRLWYREEILAQLNGRPPTPYHHRPSGGEAVDGLLA
jgi:anti-sigma regulatory factor (Ser/Thr protein kinase)